MEKEKDYSFLSFGIRILSQRGSKSPSNKHVCEKISAIKPDECRSMNLRREGKKEKKKNSKSNPVSLETRCFRDDFSGRADPRIPFTAHEGKERQLLIARGKDTRRNIQRYFSPATEIPGGDSRRNGNDLVVETRPFQDQREDVNREFSPNTVNVLLHHPGEQKDLIKTLFPSPPPLEFPVYKREQGKRFEKDRSRRLLKVNLIRYFKIIESFRNNTLPE